MYAITELSKGREFSSNNKGEKKKKRIEYYHLSQQDSFVCYYIAWILKGRENRDA